MDAFFIRNFFFVLVIALFGGFISKKAKTQPLVGYIIAGMVFSPFIVRAGVVERLSEVGLILLLFSVGVELSLKRMGKVFGKIGLGAVIQIMATFLASYFLLGIFGLNTSEALILSFGFSVSSTAVVVKMLADRDETETIHGEVMVAWLLIQDLAVIPMMVFLPLLKENGGTGEILSSVWALGVSLVVVTAAIILGRTIFPLLVHKIAMINSRELLVIAALSFALGTAYAAYLLGISPAIGAFLAGLAISATQENHAIFAETRPLRDLFVAIFFVSLGLSVVFGEIFSSLPLIVLVAALLIFLKAAINFVVVLFSGYHGKTALTISLGLSQVGEFSFIIYSFALASGLMAKSEVSFGIAVALLTLLATPFVSKGNVPLWRRLRILTRENKRLSKIFQGWDRKEAQETGPGNHVIICGYGRVGKWVGRVLEKARVPFVLIDYSQTVIAGARGEGVLAIYGDPAEPEVLTRAGLPSARAVVVAIPDRVTQEALIANVQNASPAIKIITRAHIAEDIRRMKSLKVAKVVQPEFEASMAMAKTLLALLGKEKEAIKEVVGSVRRSYGQMI